MLFWLEDINRYAPIALTGRPAGVRRAVIILVIPGPMEFRMLKSSCVFCPTVASASFQILGIVP